MRLQSMLPSKQTHHKYRCKAEQKFLNEHSSQTIILNITSKTLQNIFINIAKICESMKVFANKI